MTLLALSFRSLLSCGVILAVLPLACNREAPKPEETPPAPVQAAKAEMLPVAAWTTLLGTTQPLPNHTARISAPVEGRVQTLFQDAAGKSLIEGQQVKAGTVVAQLDTRIIREQLKQSEFVVRQAEIEVKRLETLTAANATGAMMGPLVSRIELQRARIMYEDAQSKQKGLEEQIKLYTLTTPIDGRLGLVQAVPGQTLAVGAPVVEVVDLTEIDALCFVPPHDRAGLTLGQEARIASTEAGVGPYSPGKVVFIAVQAQPDTGNFPIKVRFPNPKRLLPANAVVSVEVETQPTKERLMIPEAALIEDQNPPTVVVVRTGKNDKGEDVKMAKKLQALIGVRDREKHLVEIVALEDPDKKEKLDAKDALFITEGGAGLHDGDVVKIEEAEEK